MRRENRYSKRIFFKNIETAKRFCDLYGLNDTIISSWDIGGFNTWYYGESVRQMANVDVRMTIKEFNQMVKDIGLKEKRGNGRKYYVFE